MTVNIGAAAIPAGYLRVITDGSSKSPGVWTLFIQADEPTDQGEEDNDLWLS